MSDGGVLAGPALWSLNLYGEVQTRGVLGDGSGDRARLPWPCLRGDMSGELSGLVELQSLRACCSCCSISLTSEVRIAVLTGWRLCAYFCSACGLSVYWEDGLKQNRGSPWCNS